MAKKLQYCGVVSLQLIKVNEKKKYLLKKNTMKPVLHRVMYQDLKYSSEKSKHWSLLFKKFILTQGNKS